MWSNDAVADEDADEKSPWARDDWVPDSAVPDAAVFRVGVQRPAGPTASGPPRGIFGEPPPEDFDDHGAPRATSRSTLGRKLVAGAIVLALLIGSAGALLRNDGASEDPAPATTPTTTPVGDRPPVTLEALQPGDSSTVPANTVLAVTAPSSAGTGEDAFRDDAFRFVPSFEEGRLPRWVASTISIPENLVGIGPTEVITLSQANVLSVTEFPSGQTRSLDVSALGVGLELAVGDGTIVVFSSTELIQIRELEPVVSTSVLDGIIFVQPWTGTGSFIVTSPDTGPRAPQQDWILAADGNLEMLDNRFVDETTFFSRAFSPGGDAVVSAPGGVYAIDPAGNSRRISDGTLLATGARHWAIEECDEALRCAYSIVEWDSGTVTPGVLGPIESFGFIDPAIRISPDGRSIVYRADSDGSGRRRILDVASGTSVEAGRINQFVYPDSWVSDSSGVFIAGQPLQFVDRTTGAATAVDSLGAIRTVATGPFSR